MEMVNVQVQQAVADYKTDSTSAKISKTDTKENNSSFLALISKRSLELSQSDTSKGAEAKFMADVKGNKQAEELLALLESLKSLLKEALSKNQKVHTASSSDIKVDVKETAKADVKVQTKVESKKEDKVDTKTDNESSLGSIAELITYISQLINKIDEASKASTLETGNNIVASINSMDTKNVLSDILKTKDNKTVTKSEKEDVLSKLLNELNNGDKAFSDELVKYALQKGASNFGSNTVLTKNLPTTQEVTINELINKLTSLVTKISAEGDKTVDANSLKNVLAAMTELVNNTETETKPSSETKVVQPSLTTQIKQVDSNIPRPSSQSSSEKEGSSSDNKAETIEDKFLKKVTTATDNSSAQSFSNLVNRAAIQNDASPVQSSDKPILNKSTFTNDVIKTVKFMEINDLKDLTVKINPKELGEVVIKLVQEGNTMKATITANNKEAFQLINANVQEINNKIASTNTSIQSFSVDVFNGEGSFKNNNSGNGQESKNSKSKNSLLIDDETLTGTGVSEDDGNVNVLV